MSVSNQKYAISKKLEENASIHCTSIGIYECVIVEEDSLPRFANASDVLRNGTVTFVKSQKKTYAITCWHVVKSLRNYNIKGIRPDQFSFFTMTNGFYIMIDSFINPKSLKTSKEIDIGIREVNPDLIKSIGKEALDIDDVSMPDEINFGYAIGFPEVLRYKKTQGADEILSIPQCEILAEIDYFPEKEIILRNQLNDVPPVKEFSGMSGGPIFWSNEEKYGIFGIVYEGSTGGELTDDRGVFVFGEIAIPEEIKFWISQLEEKKL